MTKSKGNGHDAGAAQMVAVLERIEVEIKGLRGDVREVKAELGAFKDEVRGELTAIKGELRELHHEIADTNERLTAIQADLRADHGARIQRLEETVFKRTG